MKSFVNANVYVEGKGVVKTNLSFDQEIKDISNNILGEKIDIPSDAIVIPAFIDEHIHGAGGCDFMDGDIDAIKTITKTTAKEGTGLLLATTMTQSKENIIKSLSGIKQFRDNYDYTGTKVYGVHLEGPFISVKHKGAQPEQYIINPNEEQFDVFNKASGNCIRIVSYAPEEPNGMAFSRYLSSIGVVPSIGHTDATFDVVNEAIKNGTTNITHTYNAQKALHHREIGVVGSALLIDELRTEMICDTIHVSVPAMKLLVKNKPEDKLILITDSMRAKGLPDGISELGGQKVFVKGGEARLEDGTLAGSVLKMNIAVKNLCEKVGLSFTRAVDCATINPAKSLHIDKEYGSIKVGKKASFAVIDKDFNVLKTFVEGRLVYEV